jgi:hypothetical protein
VVGATKYRNRRQAEMLFIAIEQEREALQRGAYVVMPGDLETVLPEAAT